jgi:hypothetical protein
MEEAHAHHEWLAERQAAREKQMTYHESKTQHEAAKAARFGEGYGLIGEVRVTDPITGGQKGTKPERFELLPWWALEEVARVYAFGAQKYQDHNWLKGYRWSLSIGALLRHTAKFFSGETHDPESGLHHLAHAVFHCLTLITYGQFGLGTDDRPQPGVVQGAQVAKPMGQLEPWRGILDLPTATRVVL